MRNKWLGWTWSLVLGLCVVIPQRAAAQGTSTPEERARWAEITHKLESNPLDDSVNKDGEWALNRLSDAHDIHVPLCPALLGEFNDAKYKYRHEITRQYMLASGAFIIENPDKAGDTKAMNLAGGWQPLNPLNQEGVPHLLRFSKGAGFDLSSLSLSHRFHST